MEMPLVITKTKIIGCLIGFVIVTMGFIITIILFNSSN